MAIKNNHTNNGWNKNHLYAKKLHLCNGNGVVFLTADQIVTLAGISKSHAYRIIKDPVKYLTGPLRELLCIKALGQVPGWPDGWRFDSENSHLISPDGKTLHHVDLENYALTQQLFRLLEGEAVISRRRIKELENRLSLPRELRVYVNDSLKERRVLKVAPKKKTA
ncbi:phage protein [Aliamphritea ceti]|uniref:phage protein n=1 Tax=Aliamphritea ceti TaxID=1524258 RepID=UPI0021C43E38|nr:phage protein [Aliamphritea ceti]